MEAAEASEVTWLLGSIRLLTIEIFRVITLIYFFIVWHIIREYFYSVIFEISDKQMQFAGLKNTPKQKKKWYFDNFDKSKSRNTASGSWFGQKYVN